MTSRRSLLKAGAGLAAAGVVPGARASRAESQAFVLVHGTWHGGWVWRDVARILRELGHRVITPTCTGCGDRVHLSAPGVGLDTHIDDICNAIRFSEFENVVLVGHSFAGVTITGVADRMRANIGKIVFFDALVPRSGRMAGVVRDAETGEYPEWWQQRSKKFEDGYKMVLWEDYPVDMLVPPDMSAHVARLKRLITTHPSRQWTDELTVVNGGWEGLSRAYIHCVGQRYRMSSELMIGPAREAGWDFVELDAPRNAMMTHPEWSAQTLLGLAGL